LEKQKAIQITNLITFHLFMSSKAYPKNISLVTNYSNYLAKQNNKDCHDNLIKIQREKKMYLLSCPKIRSNITSWYKWRIPWTCV